MQEKNCIKQLTFLLKILLKINLPLQVKFKKETLVKYEIYATIKDRKAVFEGLQTVWS
jgi:hypothetical protein